MYLVTNWIISLKCFSLPVVKRDSVSSWRQFSLWYAHNHSSKSVVWERSLLHPWLHFNPFIAGRNYTENESNKNRFLTLPLSPPSNPFPFLYNLLEKPHMGQPLTTVPSSRHRPEVRLSFRPLLEFMKVPTASRMRLESFTVSLWFPPNPRQKFCESRLWNVKLLSERPLPPPHTLSGSWAFSRARAVAEVFSWYLNISWARARVIRVWHLRLQQEDGISAAEQNTRPRGMDTSPNQEESVCRSLTTGFSLNELS